MDVMGFQDETHDKLLNVKTRLSSFLLQEARYKEAEALAIDAREKLLELEHPDQRSISFNLRTLAAVCAEKRRYCQAELLCSELLKLLQKASRPGGLIPASVLDAVGGLETLALIYERAQRYQEAGNIYVKTVAIRDRLKGSSNMHTLKATAL
ncbi:hypothetical protein BDW62DRAFT_199093 [Aspergillus aurantiobrunneus]